MKFVINLILSRKNGIWIQNSREINAAVTRVGLKEKNFTFRISGVLFTRLPPVKTFFQLLFPLINQNKLSIFSNEYSICTFVLLIVLCDLFPFYFESNTIMRFILKHVSEILSILLISLLEKTNKICY